MSKSVKNKKNWQGKTRGGHFGYWFFILLLKKLGLGFAYFFLRFVVVYFALFAPKASKNQYWYFRKIHSYSILKSLVSIIKNFYIFGQVLLDKIALMSGIKTKFTYNFDGEDNLLDLVQNQKGGLLVGAHIGNWEIAGHLLERIKTKVHILMLDVEHERVKALLDRSLTQKKLNIIPIKEDMSHLILIKDAFARNEFVAMHGDRFIGNAKHFYFDFFNEKAAFPSGPFYMAMKFDVPICFVSAVKENATHYHFFATKPQIYKNIGNPKLRDQQIKEILKTYINNIEIILKAYPLQWFNYYDFWKHQK